MTLVPELEQRPAVDETVVVVGSTASGVCEQDVLVEGEDVLLLGEHLQRVVVAAPATAEENDEVQPWLGNGPVF